MPKYKGLEITYEEALTKSITELGYVENKARNSTNEGNVLKSTAKDGLRWEKEKKRPRVRVN